MKYSCFFILFLSVFVLNNVYSQSKSDSKPLILKIPRLQYIRYAISDTGIGTSTISPDNKIQPGEIAKINFYIKNTGKIAAQNVQYLVTCKDAHITLTKNSGTLGLIDTGTVKYFSFFISPGKTIKTSEIGLYLSLNLKDDIGGIDKKSITLHLNKEAPLPPEPPQKKPDETLVSKSKRPDAIAIIIGIEKYIDLPNATYSKHDAELITNCFQNSLGINKIKNYIDDQANWIFFDNMFNLENGELKKMINPGITDVFIYFSGHGIPSPVGEQIYLMPYDSKKDRLSSQGINITAFYDNLQHLKARNVLVFMDACFSGATRQSETLKSQNILGTRGVNSGTKSKNPWISNPSFYIFNSSASEEVSLSFDETKSGLFTYFLCLGLQGKADLNKDNKITTDELHQYINNNVLMTSSSMMSKQITQFHGNKDYVLVEF